MSGDVRFLDVLNRQKADLESRLAAPGPPPTDADAIRARLAGINLQLAVIEANRVIPQIEPPGGLA